MLSKYLVIPCQISASLNHLVTLCHYVINNRVQRDVFSYIQPFPNCHCLIQEPPSTNSHTPTEVNCSFRLYCPALDTPQSWLALNVAQLVTILFFHCLFCFKGPSPLNCHIVKPARGYTFVCVYVCFYVCIHEFVFTCVHVYLHGYIYMCMRVLCTCVLLCCW